MNDFDWYMNFYVMTLRPQILTLLKLAKRNPQNEVYKRLLLDALEQRREIFRDKLIK